MKIRSLALSLFLAVTVGVTAGCNDSGVTRIKDKDGNEIVLQIGDKNITVEDLFDNLMLSQAGVDKIYNAIDQVLIQSAYTIGDEQQEDIDALIETFEEQVRSDASTNGISYTAQREINLQNLGLKTMDELKVYYTVQVLRPLVKDAYFPSTYPNVGGERNALIQEYVENAVPMHLKHILVSVSDTKLYTGFVTEAEATKLGQVLSRLLEGDKFTTVAYEESQDTGSATKNGDLGIMDAYTSYVSEFKYGVYSYLTYGKYKGNDTVKTKLAVPATMDALYEDGFRTIPQSAIKELLEKAEETVSNPDNKDEITATYPRNNLFNQYFNFPSVAFVEYDETVPTGAKYVTVDYTLGGSKKVLADENNNPIVLVRSQYGIHLISVTRDAFQEKAVEYYTLVRDNDTTDSFVPYIAIGTSTSDKEARYDAITSAVTNYIGGAANGLSVDSNMLNYRIFKKILADKGITLNDNVTVNGIKLSVLVNDYMEAKIAAKDIAVKNTINNTWLNYSRKLDREVEVRG
jgi:hypothetical protein